MSQRAEVRRLGNQDVLEQADTLRELLLENARVNFPEVEVPVALAESWFTDLARFVGDGTAVVLGAFEGDSLKGFLWAYCRTAVGRERMHVGHIVVAAAARSRGIGQRLLDEVESLAREEGIGTIELMTTIGNTAASRFYAANGFVATRVHMEKHLSVSGGSQ